jgi:hypothetical protein
VAPAFGAVRVGQALPHAPQLLLSVLMLTHPLEQEVNPLWHAQVFILVHVAFVPQEEELMA